MIDQNSHTNKVGGGCSSNSGVFIVIEGSDGSGKGTQLKRIVQRLKTSGHEVVTFDFPRYENPSSFFIKKYLNGDYGSTEEVGPYTGSMFYALDRYEAAPVIRKALDEGKVVIANRFTGSNMAHQGAKFKYAEERRGYYIWLDNLEFQLLNIPRPDINFVLRVPAEIAQKLVDKKNQRDYTDKKRDIHEADLSFLKKSVDVYDELCEIFPKDFTPIDCMRNGELLGLDDVNELLWQKILPRLPIIEKQTVDPKNRYIKNIEGQKQITEAGKEYLQEAITNTESNVYAFTGKRISPVTAAAAMARLSRRGDDMRITLLDEFTENAGKDEDLLKRVITAYGDDSVQQLVGQHLVVEDASNLLTKKLEWGRLASYLEQSTRYIYFDKKDKNRKYKYLTPSNLDEPTKEIFEQAMNRIFDNYSKMAKYLTDYIRNKSNLPKDEQDGAWKAATRAQACDAVRSVLPVSTKSTVGIYASGQALESLIMHLLGDDLAEARTTGQKILDEARKVVPAFLERVDKPERGGANIAHRSTTSSNMQFIADKMLPAVNADQSEAVTLTDYWPKNEYDLIADMLYDKSSLPLSEIREEVSKWPYIQKQKVFEAYMGERLNRRHKPGRAIEKAHYSWDLVCDYGSFRDLQRHRIVDDLQWQKLTPRYGYDIPNIIEDANLTDLFEDCFDISLELYSKLQAAGYQLEAQYATLLGHKMRWKITYNAREAFHLHELRTSPQGHPGYRKLVKQMHDKLCEVHPSIGSAMKFVNKDEDPELTRLAAERYSQFKLNKLGQ